MATIAQLEAALIKADAAGNVDDARALAAEIRRMRAAPAAPAAVPVESEIPRRLPPISLAGDRATGFRQQVKTTGMTPEERAEAVRGMIPVAASLAAGPVAGGVIRGAAAAVPAIRAAAIPIATAIESGGFSTGLPATASKVAQAGLRVGGGAAGGALASLPFGTEDVTTGATIGALMPTAARAVVEPFRRGAAPTTKEVREAAKAAYGKVDATKIKFKPGAFNALADQLQATANKLNFVPEADTGVQAALNAFAAQVARNEPVSLSKLDRLRRTVGRKAASRMSEEGRIGEQMINDIDAFITQTVPKAVVKDLDEARDLWTKMSRGAAIDKELRMADRAVKRGQERSAAIRQRFDALRDNERKMRQFSANERDLINKLAEGTITSNMLEGVGRFLAPPRAREIRQAQGILPLATYGGAGTFLGLPAAVALGTTGYTSRAIANQLAAAEAARLAGQARTGLPLSRFAPEYVPQIAPIVMGVQGE